MNQQKINISDLQNDWSRFISQVMHGDEVIITKVDKPIAIVSPFKFQPSSKNLQSKPNDNDGFGEEKVESSSTNSEWWLG